MTRSRKPTPAAVKSAIAALMPKSRRNDMLISQETGIFACDNPAHRKAGQNGQTPGGFIDHAFSRKAALDRCNAVEKLEQLVNDGILTIEEVTIRVQTEKSPKISDVLARAGAVAK